MSTVAERHGGGGDADPGRYRDPFVDPHGELEGADVDHREDVGYVDEQADGAVVDRHRGPVHGARRADFGAHLETHYARLVAQLYAITLHPGDAHEAVQDAYSRAWRRWSELDSDDALGWIRRVAISTATRGWRTGLTRLGLRSSRLPGDGTVEPETAALLHTLDRLGAPVRRVIVLRHMAGLSISEIAELERVTAHVVRGRLTAGRAAVTEGLAGRVADALAATGHEDRAADDADGWLPGRGHQDGVGRPERARNGRRRAPGERP